jgi:hypothetical protein
MIAAAGKEKFAASLQYFSMIDPKLAPLTPESPRP